MRVSGVSRGKDTGSERSSEDADSEASSTTTMVPLSRLERQSHELALTSQVSCRASNAAVGSVSVVGAVRQRTVSAS